MINITLFASGNGSNVEAIFDYIKTRKLDNLSRVDSIQINSVFTNNDNAYVIKRCEKLRIPYFIFDKEELNNGIVLSKLIEIETDFIALCGFLLLMPKDIIDYFPKKIVNLHPALLPKYGGKGMYGMNVHREVIKNKERFSGITIHYVNEKYDKGDIIYKVRKKIMATDTPETLANKIHSLEHKFYPVILYSVSNLD